MSPNRAGAARSAYDEYCALANSYERRWQRYLDVSTFRTLDALGPREGETILDAGCGTGLLLQRIAACAPSAHLVGVDLTLAMIRQADLKSSDLMVGDVCRLPLADGSLDAVVMASVLQYLPSLDRALSEAARVLRPGGRLVITVWDGGGWCMRTLARWLKWRGMADVRLHTRGELVTSCRDQGLTIRREQAYSAGPIWQLLTIVGIKDVIDGPVRSLGDNA